MPSSQRNKKPARLSRHKAALVVVDIQERLLPAIFEKERLVGNTLKMIKGASILRIPTYVTEQYRKGLGATVPEIAGAIQNFAPIEKATFSACGAPGLVKTLQTEKISDVILCGMETHVCIFQTTLDFLESGFHVFVVADAVSSRAPENYRIGLERMRAAGAVLVSTEMTLFELLERAGTPEFKQVLELVK